MFTDRFLMGRHRDQLSAEEAQALEDAIDGMIDVGARETLVLRQTKVTRSMLLVEGVLCRYMDGLDGDRQLVALHVPGDFVDLHGYPMGMLDHDVATITPCRLAAFEHKTIERLVRTFPNLGRLLWFSTLLDAAMHREWIFRLGRLNAAGRVAHLFAETERRLAMVGLSEGERFAFPMQQTDIASACGMTAVHASRVLRDLREQGICTFSGGFVTIGDRSSLYRFAEFEDGYLYPSRR